MKRKRKEMPPQDLSLSHRYSLYICKWTVWDTVRSLCPFLVSDSHDDFDPSVLQLWQCPHLFPLFLLLFHFLNLMHPSICLIILYYNATTRRWCHALLISFFCSCWYCNCYFSFYSMFLGENYLVFFFCLSTFYKAFSFGLDLDETNYSKRWKVINSFQPFSGKRDAFKCLRVPLVIFSKKNF